MRKVEGGRGTGAERPRQLGKAAAQTSTYSSSSSSRRTEQESDPLREVDGEEVEEEGAEDEEEEEEDDDEEPLYTVFCSAIEKTHGFARPNCSSCGVLDLRCGGQQPRLGLAKHSERERGRKAVPRRR